MKIHHKFRNMIVMGLATLLAGCATAPVARTPRMIPDSFDIAKQQPYSVGVDLELSRDKTQPVMGGLFGTLLSKQDVLQAVTESLVKSDVFASVVPPEKAAYRLTVTVTAIKCPQTAATWPATVEAEWVLTSVAANQIVFRETITKTSTVKVSEEWLGNARRQLAVDRAFRENIKEGIRRLSQQKL